MLKLSCLSSYVYCQACCLHGLVGTFDSVTIKTGTVSIDIDSIESVHVDTASTKTVNIDIVSIETVSSKTIKY